MAIDIASLLNDRGTKIIIEDLINDYFSVTIENFISNIDENTDLYNYIIKIENPKIKLMNYINTSIENSDEYDHVKGKIDLDNIDKLWSRIISQLEYRGLSCSFYTYDGIDTLEISFESFFDFKFFE